MKTESFLFSVLVAAAIGAVLMPIVAKGDIQNDNAMIDGAMLGILVQVGVRLLGVS